jgi:hypothetical protein
LNSLYTIETHRGRILQKLNLHSAAEFVLYARWAKTSFPEKVEPFRLPCCRPKFTLLSGGAVSCLPFPLTDLLPPKYCLESIDLVGLHI